MITLNYYFCKLRFINNNNGTVVKDPHIPTSVNKQLQRQKEVIDYNHLNLFVVHN